MKWLAALVVVASSSVAFAQAGMRRPMPEESSITITRVEEAIRARDAKALGKLLHANVLVRGLWFPDAACTKRFGNPRTIKKAERTALAQCLAKLGLVSSTRKSSHYAAQLLTYAPGVELELAFEDGELYYLAYAHPKPSATPSLTVQAFEALRKTGTTNVDKLVAAKLDPEVARRGGTQVAAWLDVCLDKTGKANIVVSEATTPEIGAVFLAATADWTFAPFLVGKTATPICSQSLLTYPAAKAPKVEALPRAEIPYIVEVDGLGEVGGVEGGVEGEWVPGVGYYSNTAPPPPPPPPSAPPQNVAPSILEQNRIGGSNVITPAAKTVEQIKQSGKDRIIGSYKLCLDATGAVAAISQLKSTGFPDYDQKIQTEMRTWRYKPYEVNGRAVPVCTAVTFIYSQK